MWPNIVKLNEENSLNLIHHEKNYITIYLIFQIKNNYRIFFIIFPFLELM